MERSHFALSDSIPTARQGDAASSDSHALLPLPQGHLAKLITKLVHPGGGVVRHDYKFVGALGMVVRSHLQISGIHSPPILDR